HRYYITKLQSMQFCGATNYHHGFWDGFESLVLTFPAIMWVTRAFAELPRRDALLQAIRMVDDNFGFHPLMGARRQIFAQRLLSSWGDIPRLVAWYRRYEVFAQTQGGVSGVFAEENCEGQSLALATTLVWDGGGSGHAAHEHGLRGSFLHALALADPPCPCQAHADACRFWIVLVA